MFRQFVRICVPLWLLAGCAGDISPQHSEEGQETPAEQLPGPGGAQISFVRSSEGEYYTATVDASGSDWVYVDLVTQTQVVPAEPESSADWDMAFRGPEIKLNGGVSGAPPSGFAVTVYAGKEPEGEQYPFDELRSAPPRTQVGYVTDEAGALPPLTAEVLAMTTYPEADEAVNPLTQAGDHGWYRDSGILAGSVIAPRRNVGYVVQTVECRYYKLRMTGYANTDGGTGHPQFDVSKISATSECGTADGSVAPLGHATFVSDGTSTQVRLDASDEDLWVYLDLIGAQQVVPLSPADDQTWDIAWKRTDIKVNGGVSGTGGVEIYAGLREDWALRTQAPTTDYHTDEAEALAFVTYPPREIGGECATQGDGDYGWYYYSGFCDKGDGLHHISPRDVVYVVKSRDGASWKMRVLDYYDESGSSANPLFEYASIGPS